MFLNHTRRMSQGSLFRRRDCLHPIQTITHTHTHSHTHTHTHSHSHTLTSRSFALSSKYHLQPRGEKTTPQIKSWFVSRELTERPTSRTTSREENLKPPHCVSSLMCPFPSGTKRDPGCYWALVNNVQRVERQNRWAMCCTERTIHT